MQQELKFYKYPLCVILIGFNQNLEKNYSNLQLSLHVQSIAEGLQ